MGFKEILSKKRLPVETPKSIVNEKGKAVFGTFDKEFENLNLLDIVGQSGLPQYLNKHRLTQWEAVEINLKECAVLTASCQMGQLIKISLTCFYDKKTGKVTSWDNFVLGTDKVKIAEDLINGSTTSCNFKDLSMNITNNFQDGKARVEGSGNKKGDKIEYEFDLERASLPSVVSIPFGDNQPLYTQKDMFKVKGYVSLNGKKYEADENSMAIIDDHKGYYPRHSHYDWVTTMGKAQVDGKEQCFGFNLTRNQSIDQYNYNENMIWLEGKVTRLSPVKFEHLEFNKWHIKDDYGMVDIIFDITDRKLMNVKAAIITSDYHITFGTLTGFVTDEDGNKIIIDGMTGIGEDKTVKF